MLIETPISNLPIQNIGSLTAAPCKIIPTIAIKEVAASPHFRPHLFGIQPAKGVPRTAPRKTMATFKAKVAVVNPKYSVYEGSI